MLNTKDFPPLPSQKSKTPKKPKRKYDNVASINNLPDELLLEIFNHIPGLDLDKSPPRVALELYPELCGKLLNRTPNLAKLSRVSRRFHDLVADKLYSVYNSFYCEPYRFLRTIASNPRLAGSVRSLRATHDSEYEMPENYNPTAIDKRIVKNGLKATDIPEWKAWASDCNEYYAEMAEAIELDDNHCEKSVLWGTILLFTPNITELFVEDGTCDRDDGMFDKLPKWLDVIHRTAKRSPFGNVHCFTNLKNVKVEIRRLDLRHLAPIFTLPAMRKLTIIGLTELGTRENRLVKDIQRLLPAGTSSVEDFGLFQALVEKDILAVLLKCFRGLKRFKLGNWMEERREESYWLGDWMLFDDDQLPFPAFSHSKMVDSLEPHRATLEALCIRESVDKDLSMFTRPGFLTSLQHFEKLTHVEVPLSALMDDSGGHSTPISEIFPASIKAMVVTVDNYEKTAKCTKDILRLGSQLRFLPSLKQVRFDVFMDILSRNSARNRLRRMCALHPDGTKRNVFVVVESMDDDDDRHWDLSEIGPDPDPDHWTESEIDSDSESESESDCDTESVTESESENEIDDEESLYTT